MPDRHAVRFLGVLLLWIWVAAAPARAQQLSELRGVVSDAGGGRVAGASVWLVDAGGAERTTVTGTDGRFHFGRLAPAVYTLRVQASGFGDYQELAEVPPFPAAAPELQLRLSVRAREEKVTVTSEQPELSLSQDENSTALVLRGTDLEALPEDPDELAEALRALAGPAAGPDGAQFYIDGFEGGAIPSRASIREIRINQNPFSAEFDRLGFGRIDIFTRPGTNRYRGQAGFSFTDESLNSRNPFAPYRAPFQSRQFSGNLSGPIRPGRASLNLDLERRDISENAVVSASILDGSLNIVPFSEVVLTPNRRTRVSPRIDVQLAEDQTLVMRYNFLRIAQENEGVGGFSLRTRAYATEFLEHELNITETAVLSPRAVNELRFSYERRTNRQEGDHSIPGLRVLDAFTGGGAQVGLSSSSSARWEVQDFVSRIAGRHSLKAGFRLRTIGLDSVSRSNFGGTFTFGGGLAPALDTAGRPLDGGGGQPVPVPITSLERYQRTLLLQAAGKSPQEIRSLGGGAAQFSIAGGDPAAGARRTDFSIYLQDDWRARGDLLLSFGVRYETQTGIADHLDLAPRIAFAWSPGAARGSRPRTVVRGGFGIFYERFGESLLLEAERLDGTRQIQFIVSSPDFFPRVPSLQELRGAERPQTVRRVAADLQSPYTVQTALSIERQMPAGFTLTANFIHMRTLHALWSRNVNAPLAGSGARPLGGAGDVYEYQSGGFARQKQLMLSLNNRSSQALTLFANYTLGRAEGNSDGASSFPADPYDLGSEFGRAGHDVRHRFVVGGTLAVPGGLSLNPFVMGASGRPYNITTGRDANGDTVFTERPSFARDAGKPGVVATPYGLLDPNPAPGEPMIPRNLGQGPGFFLFNLTLSRTWGFGPPREEGGGPGGGPAGVWAGPGGGPAGGGPGLRMGRGPGAGAGGRRYGLNFSIQILNLLNHTNRGPVVGNLSSPLFGTSNSTQGGFGFRGPGPAGFGGAMGAAGNRRVELRLRLTF